VQSSLKYRLYVDGKEVWNTVVLSSPPVEQKTGGSIWDRFKYGG
jgi:alkaline phosphatase D